MSKRRRYGTGSKERLPSGRYRIRVPDGSSGRRGVTVDTEAEADGLLAAIAARRGRVVTVLTFGSWGEQWLASDKVRGERNVRTWQSYWRTIERAPFYDLPLDELRRYHIQEWLDALPSQLSSRGTPWSWQARKHLLGLVRRALEAARVRELIDANPADGIRLGKRPRPLATFLEQDEIDRLLSLPELPPAQRCAFTVAIYAGLRQGELAALRWQDVHLGTRPHLIVRGSWDGETKNGRARMVPLVGPAARALEVWRGTNDQLRRGHRQRGGRDDQGTGRGSGEGCEPTASAHPGGSAGAGRVFGPHARGYDWGWADKPTARVHYLGWRRRAGITRPVRFHDLRHTCASHLIMGTWGRVWSTNEVAELLGHSDAYVTERYAHLSPDALHGAAAATSPTNSPQAQEMALAAAAAKVLEALEKHSAGGARFERATFGSGGRRSTAESFSNHVQTAHRGLFERIAAQQPPTGAELAALALDFLDEPRARAALRTMAGGPHAVDAAIELGRLARGGKRRRAGGGR